MSAITWTSYLDLVRFTDVVDVRRLKSFEAQNAAFCDGNASVTMSVTMRRWYRPDARVTAVTRRRPSSFTARPSGRGICEERFPVSGIVV